MGQSSDRDKRHLELHHGQWRVVVSVPRSLHNVLPTKLKQALHTDSLALANRLKWPVIASLKGRIAQAQDGDGKGDLVKEAVEIAIMRRKAKTDEELEALDFAIEMRADQLAGEPVGVEVDRTTGREEPVLDPKRERLAGQYAAIARGEVIHPDLAAIVERRTKGKAPTDPLFPEWPGPKKAGSNRERSAKASNQFTDYRRLVGVDAVVEGKRRSLVNFHSFRRWFITEAERADQPESIIAVVVGHKRPGITLGRYSAGPLFEQAKRCVEAVRLPSLTP